MDFKHRNIFYSNKGSNIVIRQVSTRVWSSKAVNKIRGYLCTCKSCFLQLNSFQQTKWCMLLIHCSLVLAVPSFGYHYLSSCAPCVWTKKDWCHPCHQEPVRKQVCIYLPTLSLLIVFLSSFEFFLDAMFFSKVGRKVVVELQRC